jgi:hypothetical protein
MSLHLTELLGEQDTLFIHTYLIRKAPRSTRLGDEKQSTRLGNDGTRLCKLWQALRPDRNMMQIEPVAWSIIQLNAIKHKQARGLLYLCWQQHSGAPEITF